MRNPIRNADAQAVAEQQRRLCKNWLLFLMAKSAVKPATKEELRAAAIHRWGVSRAAFDFGWIDAIEETGNQHWYEPLRRSTRQSGSSKRR